MGRIDGNSYEEAKAIDIKSVLSSYGYYPNSRGKYKCPFHNEKTPSASVYKNKLHCFGGCIGIDYKKHTKASNSATYSTIDIVMLMENVDQFTAIRKLLGSETSYKRTSKKVSKAPLQSEEKEKTIQERYEEQLSYSRPIDKTNIGYIQKYFNGRCIPEALELTKGFKILEILHNFYNKQNFIIYNFPKYNFMIKKAIDGSCKLFYGSPRPVYFKMNNSFDWYVVEGIEDCFSLLLAHKVNAVCLNSTSGVPKFKEKINEKPILKKLNYVIATDLDGSGEKARNELIRFFKENNVKYSLYKSFYDYACKYNLKDLNECLIHSKLKDKKE